MTSAVQVASSLLLVVLLAACTESAQPSAVSQSFRAGSGGTLAPSATPAVTTPPILANEWPGDRSLLEHGGTRSYTGSRITVTESLRTFDHSVWISGPGGGPADRNDNGLIVDRTELVCHGGVAHVTWHIGNLEPTTEDVGIHLTARLDGEPIASVLRGTRVDTWGDHPLDLETVIDCPSGEHVLDMLVRSIHGQWGFPYVNNPDEPPSPDLRVGRGFIVTETWE